MSCSEKEQHQLTRCHSSCVDSRLSSSFWCCGSYVHFCGTYVTQLNATRRFYWRERERVESAKVLLIFFLSRCRQLKYYARGFRQKLFRCSWQFLFYHLTTALFVFITQKQISCAISRFCKGSACDLRTKRCKTDCIDDREVRPM